VRKKKEKINSFEINHSALSDDLNSVFNRKLHALGLDVDDIISITSYSKGPFNTYTICWYKEEVKPIKAYVIKTLSVSRR